MALVVETGAGLATAESYLSAASFRARAAALGLAAVVDSSSDPSWLATRSDADTEAALRRATSYVDLFGWGAWLGQRAQPQTQALEWPRAYVPSGGAPDPSMPLMYSASLGRRSYAFGGVRAAIGVGLAGTTQGFAYLDSAAVPPAVLTALTHAAARELARPGSMLPDWDGGDVVSESVGPVSVTYSSVRQQTLPTFPVVERLLAPLTSRGGGGSALLLGRA